MRSIIPSLSVISDKISFSQKWRWSERWLISTSIFFITNSQKVRIRNKTYVITIQNDSSLFPPHLCIVINC